MIAEWTFITVGFITFASAVWIHIQTRRLSREARNELDEASKLLRRVTTLKDPESREVETCPECSSVLWEKSRCGVCGYEFESKPEH